MKKYTVLEDFVMNGKSYKKGEVIELDYLHANLKSIQKNIVEGVKDLNATTGAKNPEPVKAPEVKQPEPVKAPEQPAPVVPPTVPAENKPSENASAPAQLTNTGNIVPPTI